MEARQIRQTVNVYKLDSGSVFYSKMDQNLGVKYACLYSYDFENDVHKESREVSVHLKRYP